MKTKTLAYHPPLGLPGPVVPRTNAEVPDFTWGKEVPCKVKLEWRWRGPDEAFWCIRVAGLGPFHGPIEIHIKQAEAIASAVAELQLRLAGYSYNGSDAKREKRL